MYQVELMSQEQKLYDYLMMSNVRSVRELIEDLLDRGGYIKGRSLRRLLQLY